MKLKLRSRAAPYCLDRGSVEVRVINGFRRETDTRHCSTWLSLGICVLRTSNRTLDRLPSKLGDLSMQQKDPEYRGVGGKIILDQAVLLSSNILSIFSREKN